MIRLILSLFLILGCSTLKKPATSIAASDPSVLYAELFEAVQLQGIFPDSKYFVDLVPVRDPAFILRDYRHERPQSREQLRAFVERNFSLPPSTVTSFESRKDEDINAHIKRLWPALRREPTGEIPEASSLIALPHAYVVPGGRFREIYYWDSYFTMLGLLIDNEEELFQGMVRNFAHLIETVGHVPNGNRDYYRGRSQPPFFGLMVNLWKRKYGADSAREFLPALKKEHAYWMNTSRAVELAPGETLNRYWDEYPAPRPEAYKEDVKLAEAAAPRDAKTVYRNLRAAAESGWDFSTRWFEDGKNFSSIKTTSFIPVDLNSLLYALEVEIAQLSPDTKEAEQFRELSKTRRKLIHEYLWNGKAFVDYNLETKNQSTELTVAMVVPLFTGVATPAQARSTNQLLQKQFLKSGGLVTTLKESGQQWDAPNGWAPHQWMGYLGALCYGDKKLSDSIRSRWMKLNEKVYISTGKLMEKYDVVHADAKAGGGEYPNQDGFGWTNGVYRALEVQSPLLEICPKEK